MVKPARVRGRRRGARVPLRRRARGRGRRGAGAPLPDTAVLPRGGPPEPAQRPGAARAVHVHRDADRAAARRQGRGQEDEDRDTYEVYPVARARQDVPAARRARWRARSRRRSSPSRTASRRSGREGRTRAAPRRRGPARRGTGRRRDPADLRRRARRPRDDRRSARDPRARSRRVPATRRSRRGASSCRRCAGRRGSTRTTGSSCASRRRCSTTSASGRRAWCASRRARPRTSTAARSTTRSGCPSDARFTGAAKVLLFFGGGVDASFRVRRLQEVLGLHRHRRPRPSRPVDRGQAGTGSARAPGRTTRRYSESRSKGSRPDSRMMRSKSRAGHARGRRRARGVGDDLVHDRADQVVRAEEERHLRELRADLDPVGLDVRHVVEQEPRDRDDAQVELAGRGAAGARAACSRGGTRAGSAPGCLRSRPAASRSRSR